MRNVSPLRIGLGFCTLSALFLLFGLTPILAPLPPSLSAAQFSNHVQNADISVYFSPHGGCTEAIVHAIEAAQRSIYVQAYTFTSAPIARALRDARRRGLDVQVLLDKSQQSERYSAADYLAHAGIPTLIDAQHKIAHNKILIIDGIQVWQGSFNFTKSAETENAENLLGISSPGLAALYLQNWTLHAGHSTPYRGRGQ